MEGKEWEGEFDPLSDPEEKRHILSVLDSFRYVTIYDGVCSNTEEPQLLSTPSTFQWHPRAPTSFLLSAPGALDDAIEATLLSPRIFKQIRRSN